LLGVGLVAGRIAVLVRIGLLPAGLGASLTIGVIGRSIRDRWGLAAGRGELLGRILCGLAADLITAMASGEY